MHHIDVQCEGNIFKPGTQLRAAAWFLEIILSANVGVGMCPTELITSHMIGMHNNWIRQFYSFSASLYGACC